MYNGSDSNTEHGTAQRVCVQSHVLNVRGGAVKLALDVNHQPLR